MAQQIIAGIEALNQGEHYSGLHLRVEGDAGGFHARVGGIRQFWQLHKEAMQRAGFDASRPVYLATALPKIAIGDSGAGAEGTVQPRMGSPTALGDLLYYASDMRLHQVRRTSPRVCSTIVSRMLLGVCTGIK